MDESFRQDGENAEVREGRFVQETEVAEYRASIDTAGNSTTIGTLDEFGARGIRRCSGFSVSSSDRQS